MKNYGLLLLPLALAACDNAVKIADLALPPVVMVEGEVTRLGNGDFVLKDDSGSIAVEVDEATPHSLKMGEHVKVLGNLDPDDVKEFNASRLIRADGTMIDFTPLQPHYGIILQHY